MRIESPARMEQRLSNPSRPPRQTPPSHSRKSRRRSGRRSNPLDAWPQNAAPQGDQDGGLVAGVEYPPQMLWQSPSVPPNVPGNGQRLFTAMSDPSVCSYSPMPMTYTMQPVSLPAMYRMYQPMPVPNIRTVHSRQRHHCNKHSAHARPGANNNVANGYESLQENGVLEPAVHIALQNGDYTSLPPTANKDSGVNGDELNSEHRRYSDPGLGPAGNSDSDDSDSVESGSSVTTISRSNKLVLSLIEQMTELKKCNSQLFKELSETKSNLENVKAKLAQCKHSTPADYQPGMLSELIREIREANKNCEEGLVTKVKSMFEERCNQQAKEMNELKNQLAKLMKEKEESDQRVAKLEEEVTVLKLSATNEDREIAVFEEENLALRRELQEARASRTLAENHVAKCVDFAVSRSVTPVTFDTPCITSTPVRTALTDTRFLLPAIPPALYTSSASSVLRSRSAEVAALQPIFEADQCQNFATDCEPVSFEDSPTKEAVCKRAEMFLASCHTGVTSTSDDVIDILDKIAKYSGLIDNGSICKILTKVEVEDHLGFRAKEARNAIENDDKITSTEEETRMMSLRPLNSIPEELLEDLLRTKIKYFQSRKENKIEVQEILEQQKDLSDKSSEADVASEAEKLASQKGKPRGKRYNPKSINPPSQLQTAEDVKDVVFTSDDLFRQSVFATSMTSKEMNLNTMTRSNDSDNHSLWQKLSKFHNQPGRFKKPRRKKGSVKKLFSETDELDEVSCQDTEVLTDKVPPCSSESNRDTVDEDEDRFPNDDRAIVDMPDVVVIGGGSIVPKNLCSMRTLTSRTQTAPSRATYTTAYI